MKRKIEVEFYKGSIVKPSEFHGRVGEINGLEIVFHYCSVPKWRRVSHFIRDGDTFFMCFEAGDSCKISSSEFEVLMEYNDSVRNKELNKTIFNELLLDIAKGIYSLCISIRSLFKKKG